MVPSDEVIPETVSTIDAICISDNVSIDSVSDGTTQVLNSHKKNPKILEKLILQCTAPHLLLADNQHGYQP